MPFRIDPTAVSDRPWGEVDKTELRQRLLRGLQEREPGAAEAIREVYAVIRSDDLADAPSSNWVLPHHEIRPDGTVVLNRYGLAAAAGSLAGARSEVELTPEQRRQAAEHLRRHYRQLELEPPEAVAGKLAEIAGTEPVALVWGELGPDVPETFQVLPFGRVRSTRGEFLFDEQAMQELMAWWNGRLQRDLVIDYEHQTLTGQEAPAAGWIVALENRQADGLWARAQWTERAREYLRRREYRYQSPVVLVRKSDRRIVALHSVALTNTPAIDGLVPIVNKAGKGESDVSLLERLRKELGLPDATEEKVFEAVVALKRPGIPKEVLAELGLSDGASIDQVKEKLVALKQAPVAHEAILAELGLGKDATLEQVKGKILALKNPSGYVRVEEFQALKERLDRKEAEELVAQALKDGKITPAQKEWATQQALKDRESFRAFLAVAPRVVPVGTEIAGGQQTPQPELDEIQLAVNKQLGLSDEVFKKWNKRA